MIRQFRALMKEELGDLLAPYSEGLQRVEQMTSRMAKLEEQAAKQDAGINNLINFLRDERERDRAAAGRPTPSGIPPTLSNV